jgi:class 3 adenylate cyclase/predicted ATPase
MVRADISGQITGYVAASRTAAMDGDWERARSLAARALALDLDDTGARGALDDYERTTGSTSDRGERRQLTVLFCDLEGSVSLSERLDPEALRDVLVRYQEVCHEVTRRYGGYLADYRGDGVIAYFGYPRAHEDDARHAVQAGLEMVLTIPTIAFALDDKDLTLRCRVGIDTGLVVTGPVGATAAPLLDAVTGLAPNLAARLEGLAGTGHVLVSDVTASLVESYFDLESRGHVDIKGLSDSLEVFAVEAERAAADRRSVLRYRVSPLVGRRDECSALARCWSSFVSRSPDGADANQSSPVTSVALVGPAGIGKTRLAWHLIDLAQRQGAKVLEADCAAMDQGRDLIPARQILADIIPIDRAAPAPDQGMRLVATLQALGLEHDLAPFIADLLSLSPEVHPLPALDPLELHQRFQRVVIQVLEAVASAQPLVLLLEDIQWADASTIELIGRLLISAHPHLLLVLTSRRPETIPGTVSATIRLGPLDADSAAALVRSVVDGDDEIVASIAERGGGVPVFTVELARFHGSPRPVGARLLGTGASPLPPALADLIASQLDALGPHRPVAQAAAVVGREFTGTTVVELAGVSGSEDEALAPLLDADLIERSGQGSYRFRHSLFQELAYETLLSTTRSQLHGQLVERMLASGTADPSLVAFHLAHAGRLADAVVYHQIAALSAQERTGAHAVALHSLDESLRLLDQLAPEERPPLELATRVLRGLSLIFTESYASPAAAADYRRALALCEEMDYSPLIVPLTVAVWSYYTVSGDLATAGAVVDGLLRMATSAEGAFFGPEIETCAAVQRFYEGRFAHAAVHFANADAGYSLRGDEPVSAVWRLPNDPLVATWSIGAANSWVVGDDIAGDIAIERAISRARSLPFPTGPFSECFALVGAIWLAELRRDNAASLSAAGSLVALAAIHAYPFWGAVGALRAGIAAGRSGDAASAADEVAAAIELWHALGVKAYGPCNLASLAELRLLAGDIERASADIDNAIAAAESTGERFFLAEALRIRGEILVAASRFDDAVSSLTQAFTLARQQGAARFQLRSAIALNTLIPSELRDPSWLDLLAEATANLATTAGPELELARRLTREPTHPELSGA